MRKLTRIKQIQALESSARHGSFVGAADELGVTPAAVGQLVRSLESWVGYPLFRRAQGGRERLQPVEETVRALEDISAGLDRLEAGLERLRSRKVRRTVVVSVSQAFAANWLIMRLHEFSDQYPKIDLRLDVSDRLVDLVNHEADIGVRFGPGNWPGLLSSLLMKEEMIAVCSPALRPSDEQDTAWVSRLPLIHNVTRYSHSDIPTWEDWNRAFGIDHRPPDNGLEINSTAAVIQAAIAGRGIALVRKALVAQHIAFNRLIRLWPQWRFPISHAYFAVVHEPLLHRAEVAAFHDWLLCHATTDEQFVLPSV